MNATARTVAWWLVVIAALNAGLIALVSFDLVNTILGSLPVLERLFYILVGLSGLWMLYEKVGRR